MLCQPCTLRIQASGVAADKVLNPGCLTAPCAAAEMASGKSLAVARVLGALCVLTACDGEGEGAAEGAMLASWVSQVHRGKGQWACLHVV